MMAGGDVQNLHILQLLRNDAPLIHGNMDAGDAAGLINIADFPVARVLHAVTQISAQQLDEDIIKEIRAGPYQNVLRVHGHAPEGGQMGGDGSAQLRDAVAGDGQQQLLAVVQHYLPLEAAPDGEGKPLAFRVRGLGR